MDAFFHPVSIAVIGASGKPTSLGFMVMRNLLDAGFDGPIMPVNPKYESVCGVLTYSSVEQIPIPADLAVICAPPQMVPGLIESLGNAGTRAAVVLTAGLNVMKSEDGTTLQDQMLEKAHMFGMRIIGPNCLGIAVPSSGINASFAHTDSLKGSLAFVSQSGALSTAVLDWAKSSGIGFSCFLSLGNSADVNFCDALEYLADDPSTTAILLYVESIVDAPRFMRAASMAATKKSVFAIKSGRVAAAQKAAASHTGALAGSDEVYDAAFRQAGILRVQSIEDLFGAVEILGKAKPLDGDGLGIFSNGGGPGVMATDCLIMNQGRLAEFSDTTLQRLDEALPEQWSKANPADIIGDAAPERYVDTLKILLDDPDSAAILFINAPSAIVPSEVIAKAMLEIARNAKKTVFTCWLGRDGVAAARQLFSDASIPCFDTPEDAVIAFLDMVRFRRSQRLIGEETGDSYSPLIDGREIRDTIEVAQSENRSILSELESKSILTGIGISVSKSRLAKDATECEIMASEIGYPVVLKIISPDISHKSDVGGVALNLENPEEVVAAANAMRARVHAIRPDATLLGFSVQQMVKMPSAHELIIGLAKDPVFGPVVMFGHGGTAVEVIRDHAVALPPLTPRIALDMINQTRVSKLLAGYRDRPKANIEAIRDALMRLSVLVTAFPEIEELDVNPLLASDEGVIALDARIKIRLLDPASKG